MNETLPVPAAHRSPTVVLTTPHWSVGGVPTFCRVLAHALSRAGRNVQVLITDPRHERCDALPLPDGRGISCLNTSPAAGRGARREALRAHLESVAPCVYVPNHDWHNSWIAPRLSNGVALVGVAHADDEAHRDHISRLAPWWNAVVAVSAAVAAGLEAAVPSWRGRIETIPNGVDSVVAAREPRGEGVPIRLAYVGRVIHEQKRVMELVGIARCLREAAVPFEMRIAGDGPDHGELVEAVTDAGLTDRFVFEGALPREAVINLLDHSDALLLPSGYEGLPFAALEAMSRACVPIVTDAACGPELVADRETGFRAPVGDVETFAARIAELASDPTLTARLGNAARERVATPPFTAEHMGERWQAVLDRASADVASPEFLRPRHPAPAPPGAGVRARVTETLRTWARAGNGGTRRQGD